MHPTERLIRKLQITTGLDAEDVRALERLPISVKELAAHSAIVREGERPAQCCLLIDGFVCRSKTTDAGKNWLLEYTEQNPKAFLDCMAFRDATHGIVRLKEGEGKDLHVHGCADLLTSWAPLPRRRAPRQGAFLRRNSGRVPRTSAGRFRSSGAGR